MPTRSARRCWVRWIALLGVAWATVAMAAPEVAASTVAQLGDVTVRLHSWRYFRNGDYTRFVYQVTGPDAPSCEAWVLGLCDAARASSFWTGSDTSWVDEPIAGIRFVPRLRNEKFYLYLEGSWGVSPSPVGVWADGGSGDDGLVTDWIDGPSCGSSSLSISVLSGSDVSFPLVTGAGVFAALQETRLRVESTTAGWALSLSKELIVPAGASEEVVLRVVEVDVGPYAAEAGTTELDVNYRLRVGEADLPGLPEGTYDVSILFTVFLD
ncbi:MAG: hypothetical protein AB1778_07675 [Candidatus Bipolaricaulota bacterium]